ncbi:MAG: acetyltransferase [Caldilineaceae bacterium]
MGILIVGAGGHGQVVADILLQASQKGMTEAPIGYLDDDPTLHGQWRLKLPIVGAIAQRTTIPHNAVIVAIGCNTTRRRFYTELLGQGETFATACHPSAVIAPDVQIGPGSVIGAGVIVNTGSVIGVNVILNTGATIDHHNIIADHVHLAPGVHLGGDVQIEAATLIGIGATVMPQRRIGPQSIVGAGALVTRDLPGDSVAMGVPARVVRRHATGTQTLVSVH